MGFEFFCQTGCASFVNQVPTDDSRQFITLYDTVGGTSASRGSVCSVGSNNTVHMQLTPALHSRAV